MYAEPQFLNYVKFVYCEENIVIQVRKLFSFFITALNDYIFSIFNVYFIIYSNKMHLNSNSVICFIDGARPN